MHWDPWFLTRLGWAALFFQPFCSRNLNVAYCVRQSLENIPLQHLLRRSYVSSSDSLLSWQLVFFMVTCGKLKSLLQESHRNIIATSRQAIWDAGNGLSDVWRYTVNSVKLQKQNETGYESISSLFELCYLIVTTLISARHSLQIGMVFQWFKLPS